MIISSQNNAHFYWNIIQELVTGIRRENLLEIIYSANVAYLGLDFQAMMY